MSQLILTNLWAPGDARGELNLSPSATHDNSVFLAVGNPGRLSYVWLNLDQARQVRDWLDSRIPLRVGDTFMGDGYKGRLPEGAVIAYRGVRFRMTYSEMHYSDGAFAYCNLGGVKAFEPAEHEQWEVIAILEPGEIIRRNNPVEDVASGAIVEVDVLSHREREEGKAERRKVVYVAHNYDDGAVGFTESTHGRWQPWPEHWTIVRQFTFGRMNQEGFSDDC